MPNKQRQQLIKQYGKKKGIAYWKQLQKWGKANPWTVEPGGASSSPGDRGDQGNANPPTGNPKKIEDRPYNLDPIRNFRFRVRIQPYSVGQSGWDDNLFTASMGFTSVAGLSTTIEAIPMQEGGLNSTIRQLPGVASYQPITFQRGIYLGNQENWQWLRRITGTVGNSGYGAPGGNFRCAVRIDVLSHPNPGSRAVSGGQSDAERSGFYDNAVPFGEEVNDDHASMSFLLSRAWISTLSYSDLNAGDSALVVEQLTLVHEGLHLDWSAGWSRSNNIESDESANAFRHYSSVPNPRK